MKQLALACLAFFFFRLGEAQELPAPYRLRCDLLLNCEQVRSGGLSTTLSLEQAATEAERYPFSKIFSTHPVFHWEVDSSIQQTLSARIIVRDEHGLYWDSRRIANTQNRMTYQGKALKEGQVYRWKVQIWDNKGRGSAFSKEQAFYLSAPEDSLAYFSYHPLAAEVQLPQTMHQTGGEAYFLDFGKAAFAQLKLRLSSEYADTVWIEAGEALKDPQTIDPNAGRSIRYIKLPLYLRPGTHTYSLEWPVDEKRNTRNPIQMPAYIGEVFPFRYVTLKGYTGKLQADQVERKIVFYPFNEAASYFSSSDTILNQVWDLCKYSMKATSFCGYYVDGDRERLPYEADALINQLSHYAVDAEYSIARRSMQYLIYHPTWPTEWSLQHVLMAWYDYMYTGDDGYLRRYYPDLRHKTLMALEEANGLISTRTGKQTDDFLRSIYITKRFDNRRGLHDIVDWPQVGNYTGNEKEHPGETDGFVFTNYNAVVNAFYYQNLRWMERIATVLGKQEDAELFKSKANRVYAAYRSVFRNPQTGLICDGDSTRHSSLHANMFALAFDLVPTEEREQVAAFIQSRGMACSVYGSQFLLEALYSADKGDYALELMRATTERSWYNMIRKGSTISMEAWDLAYKPNLDLNHAWGAAPANIIVRKLMGVEPLKPGFDSLLIRPQPGALRFAQLTTPSIKGPISVDFRRDEEETHYRVVIPGACQATLHLPYEADKPDLYVNGEKQAYRLEEGRIILENIAAGSTRFTLK